MIIHHTDCGFTYFKNNNQILASLLVRSLFLLIIMKSFLFCFKVQTGRRTDYESCLCQPLYQGEKPDFMPIMDMEQSIHNDLVEYRQHPLLDQNAIVRGFLYNTKSGLLKEIEML